MNIFSFLLSFFFCSMLYHGTPSSMIFTILCTRILKVVVVDVVPSKYPYFIPLYCNKSFITRIISHIEIILFGQTHNNTGSRGSRSSAATRYSRAETIKRRHNKWKTKNNERERKIIIKSKSRIPSDPFRSKYHQNTKLKEISPRSISIAVIYFYDFRVIFRLHVSFCW